MGSFSFTCCVSGLPIEAGDPVRYFLLSENPYEDSHKCYIHDLWHPRTFPLRAKYNEYGSVEEVEDSAHKQSWLDSLKFDLAPVGWGENSCHDTATSKDMSFERLLEAVWEGRVKVRREVDVWILEPEMKKWRAEYDKKNKAKKVVPKGVPTRKRLTAILNENDIPVFDGAHTKGSVIVGRQSYGRYRLRHGDFGFDGETLKKAETVLKAAGYATMLTKGAGSSSFDGELLVRPLPSVKDYHFMPRETRPPIQVRQAMIREDVWQALASLEVEAWDGSLLNRARARAGAEKAWSGATKEPKKGSFLNLDIMELRDGRDTYFYLKDTIPFTVGLGTMFQLMGKKYLRGEVPEAEVASFLDTAADLTVITSVLSSTRYQWRPSYSNGPQFGEWGLHKTVTDALAKVTNAKAEEARLEREKYERESAEFEKQLKAKKARKKAAKKK